MTDETKQPSVEVLAERIKGLTDSTTLQLQAIKETLNRMEANNAGFATKIELEETKKDFNKTIQEIYKGLEQHNIDDKASFGELAKGQKEVRDIVIRWGGGVAVILFLLAFIAPMLLNRFFHIG